MDLAQKLSFFRELLRCGHALYATVLDRELRVVDTSCPFAAHIPALLGLDGNAEAELHLLAEAGAPVIITGYADLLWILDYEKEQNELCAYHLIGPVFIEDIASYRLESAISELGISGGDKRRLSQQLSALPLLPINHFMDYGLMLHYCLWGEHLDSGSFCYADRKSSPRGNRQEETQNPSHGTWAMEQELLRLIEEGNLDYRKRAAQLVGRGRMAPLGNGDTLRHFKNAVIIFTSLCARAAIRGGLSPEVSYTLADRCINNVESARSFEEVARINESMQDDYVRRVHECRSGASSPLMQKLREYLDTHLDNTPSVPEIAEEMGCSPSYLAREFKKQTGLTMQQYLRSRRIELAMLALRSSEDSVQNICHSLGFGSQSYFTAEFRKAVGMTPAEYRRRNGV